MKKNLLVFLLINIVLLSSCEKELPISIPMEKSPILTAGLGYAVVNSAYAKAFLENSYNSASVSTLRGGDVCKVVARKRSFSERDSGTWYCIECSNGNGWIHESEISVYHSQAEANKKSRSFH